MTIEGVTLTGSDFHDGGGFVADPTGGSPSSSPGDRSARRAGPGHRRDRRSVSPAHASRRCRCGRDPRYRSRSGADPGNDWSDRRVPRGPVVRVVATVVGRPTALTSGVAFDVDDGSGETRVLVGTETGIETAAWASGTTLELVGVAGQRDSSGSGQMATACSRVTPVTHPTSPTVSQTPSPSADRSHSKSARRAPRDGHRRARSRCRDDPDRPSRRADGRCAGRNRRDPPSPQRGCLPAPPPPARRGGRQPFDLRRHGIAACHGARRSLNGRGAGRTRDADRRRRRRRRGSAGRRSRRDRRIRPTVVERDGLVRDRRRQRAPAHQYPELPACRPRFPGRWLLGRGARSGRPGDQRFEAERGIPSLATRPIGGAGHRAGRRWKRLRRRPGGRLGGAGSGGSYAGPTGSLDDLGTADLSRLRIGATIVVGPWKEMRVGGLLGMAHAWSPSTHRPARSSPIRRANVARPSRSTSEASRLQDPMR